MLRRSILWLIPFIVIALAVMLGMQYRFLRTLEETTVLAERNALRTTLDNVAQSLDEQFRAAASRAVGMSSGELRSLDASAEHFRLNGMPAARAYFTMVFDPEPQLQFLARDGSRPALDEAEVRAVKLALIGWMVVSRDHGPWPTHEIAVDARDPRNRVVYAPVADANGRLAGLAGFVVDEGAARAYLATMAKSVMKKQGGHADFMTVTIGDSRMFRRTAGDRSFVTQPMGFGFSDWRLGLRDMCASPEELAAYNFRVNAMWTGGAALVLFLAIALAVQAAWRHARLSQMKSDFVSNVSHELRTPLASIRVFGEYMRLGRVTAPEKIREYGGYIENESRRLTALINNILDFSRIESAEKQYKFAPTDLEELLCETVQAFETPLQESGVRVALAVPDVLPPVMADRGALGQALVNLLDNAWKYSGDRKEIAVHAGLERDFVAVSVRDRGIGIAAPEQKKIFEKFYRVGTSLVHDVKGSGLGLAIVQHIIRAHGGDVRVDSTPGEGSTFTLLIPSAVRQPLENERNLQRAETYPAAGEHA